MRESEMRAAARDAVEFEQAKRAAGGDVVEPIRAGQVRPNMAVWHNGRWLRVRFRRAAASGEAVMLDYFVPEANGTAFRVASPSVRMFRRVPRGRLRGKAKAASEAEAGS